MKLYELTGAYQNIRNMMEEGTEGLEDTLFSIEDSIEVKAENIASLIKEFEYEAAVMKEEEARFKAKKESAQKNADRLKELLKDNLLAVGKEKIKGTRFNITLANTPGKVVFTNEKLIPEEFFIPQPPIIDKKSIGVLLKEGAEVPGATLVKDKSLRIK